MHCITVFQQSQPNNTAFQPTWHDHIWYDLILCENLNFCQIATDDRIWLDDCSCTKSNAWSTNKRCSMRKFRALLAKRDTKCDVMNDCKKVYVVLCNRMQPAQLSRLEYSTCKYLRRLYVLLAFVVLHFWHHTTEHLWFCTHTYPDDNQGKKNETSWAWHPHPRFGKKYKNSRKKEKNKSKVGSTVLNDNKNRGFNSWSRVLFVYPFMCFICLSGTRRLSTFNLHKLHSSSWF